MDVEEGSGERGGFKGEADLSANRLPSRWTIIGLLVLSLAVAWTWWQSGSKQGSPVQVKEDWNPSPDSIAVLPFEDLSEGGDKVYLAEGISEEILNSLAQSTELTVVARTSSFSFKDTRTAIRAIARQLNVAHVLEGSVRAQGERVRVTVQLVDGATEAHVWSQTYEDQLRDVFALQDRIAQEVAGVLQVELADQDPVDGEVLYTPDPQAWESYVRGRLYYSRRGTGDILRAQRSFEEALEIDPLFADAWVSLAATYRVRSASSNLAEEEVMPMDVAMPRIRDVLQRALSLNPDHPEALWRFSLFTWIDGQVDQTLDQLNRAIALGNNVAIVQAMAGGFMFDTGHPELAIPFLRRAVSLDPVSASHRKILGYAYYFCGRFDKTEAAWRHLVELNKDATDEVHSMLTWTSIHQDRISRARMLADEMPPGADKVQATAILAHMEGRHGASEEALEQLASMRGADITRRLAYVHAMRGEHEEALHLVMEATREFKARSGGRRGRGELNLLLFSPFLKPLQAEEQWQSWYKETRTLFLEEVDFRVIDLLTAHLQANPEFYDDARQESSSKCADGSTGSGSVL